MAVAEQPPPTRKRRLRRSDPSGPGYARRRCGKGFMYLDEDGGRLTDPEIVARITALVIPPAWRDAWISPDPVRPHPGHRLRRGRAQAVPLPPALARAPRPGEVRRHGAVRARAAGAARGRRARPRARRPLARADPRVRRPAAGSRLLPHRLGGLRGDERDLRPRDDAQVPRDGRAATRSASTTSPRSPSAASRPSSTPRSPSSSRRSSAAAAAATSCSPTSATAAGATCARRTSTPTSRPRPASTSRRRTSARGARRCWPPSAWPSPSPRR